MQKTQTKREDDDNGNGNGSDTPKTCPPGMKLDGDKCVPVGERLSNEDDNAGDVTPAGTQAGESPNELPADNPHACPEGSTWNKDANGGLGACEPTAQKDAGTIAGSDNPSAGKEFAKAVATVITPIMAEYASFFGNMVEEFKKSQKANLEILASGMGVPVHSSESAAFGVKKESSSKVDDSQYQANFESSVATPAAWFEKAKSNKKGGQTQVLSESIQWWIKPEAYFETLHKKWISYGSSMSISIPKQESSMGSRLQTGSDGKKKSEAFTISGGDMPQIFAKQIYLIPGGRMRVPIRQFLDTQIIEDSDRYNWYKVNGFDFDDTTAEGTEPTNEAQTVTKVTATPSLKRAVQTVNYSDIENAPFDLIEAFNRAAALGALSAESTEVLDTTYDAISPTNWVNGNTGAEITADDTSGMTLKQEGLYSAKRLIETQGGDTSPGNLVFFAHPKAVEELILDTAADFFTGQGALHSTALGILENRLGFDIVVNNKVAAQDNTTNDTYRNILAVKGSIGLAVAADLQIEAQRRPDLSAVKVGARHRIKGAVIDETMTCRVSTAQ
jgi:hypothetical protein